MAKRKSMKRKPARVSGNPNPGACLRRGFHLTHEQSGAGPDNFVL